MFNIGPYGGSNRVKLDNSGYVKVGIGAIIIIALIALTVLEFRHFDLLLNPKLLLVYALVLGLILGTILGKKFSEGIKETYEKVRIYVVLIMASIIFMPLFVSLTNRLLDFRTPEKKAVIFENAEAYISERYGVMEGETAKIAGYKIVLVMDQEILQLKSKKHPFPNAKKGDTVELTIKKGLLGIKYVKL